MTGDGVLNEYREKTFLHILTSHFESLLFYLINKKILWTLGSEESSDFRLWNHILIPVTFNLFIYFLLRRAFFFVFFLHIFNYNNCLNLEFFRIYCQFYDSRKFKASSMNLKPKLPHFDSETVVRISFY